MFETFWFISWRLLYISSWVYFQQLFMTYDRPLVEWHWGDQNTCPSTTLSTVHTTCSGPRLCWRAGGKWPVLLDKPLWLETDYFITAGLLTAEEATMMPNRDQWPTFKFNINYTSYEKKNGLDICKNCTDPLYKFVCNFSNFMESHLRNVADEHKIPSTTECIWNV
jgi:hypothetical protein